MGPWCHSQQALLSRAPGPKATHSTIRTKFLKKKKNSRRKTNERIVEELKGNNQQSVRDQTDIQLTIVCSISSLQSEFLRQIAPPLKNLVLKCKSCIYRNHALPSAGHFGCKLETEQSIIDRLVLMRLATDVLRLVLSPYLPDNVPIS